MSDDNTNVLLRTNKSKITDNASYGLFKNGIFSQIKINPHLHPQDNGM